MAISTQPIGITLPIAHGPSGYFNQSYNVLDQIKSNLHMLLRTKKGERRMKPDFGSGLWNLLFEFNGEEMSQMVESTIRRDVQAWMPYLKIESVSVLMNNSEIDKNAIGVSVSFTVPSAGISTPQILDVVV